MGCHQNGKSDPDPGQHLNDVDPQHSLQYKSKVTSLPNNVKFHFTIIDLPEFKNRLSGDSMVLCETIN